ncbi:MAG: branched-chain amino acid ABC transporter substrate-binding protein [Jatrophihabitantaceae bacterium]
MTTLTVVLTASAVAVSGCSSSKKKDKGGGLGGSGSSKSSAPVKIGFEGPLSGDNAQLGINEVNAVQLAVDQANKDNTYGFKVTLVKSDDVGDPAKAPAAATTLQQDPAIIGVIGPSFSGATKAVGASYDAANLVLISPSATNPTLTSRGFKSFHRVVPPDSLEGKEAGDYLAKKAKSVYVIDDLSDYGKGAADAVQAELKSKNIKVTRDGVEAKTTDYSVIAQKIKSSNAGALFYGGYDTQAALFARALKSAGYTGLTMTGNGGKSSKFTSGAGAAGNGWYFSCGCLDATVAPQAKAFNDAYVKAFNTAPSTYSPEAFDATNALLTAIKDASAGGAPTRKSVFDAVNKLDYKGITTEIKFEPNGEVSAQVINLYVQKSGKIGLLGDIKSS